MTLSLAVTLVSLALVLFCSFVVVDLVGVARATQVRAVRRVALVGAVAVGALILLNLTILAQRVALDGAGLR